jgi:hypothetical protein
MIAKCRSMSACLVLFVAGTVHADSSAPGEQAAHVAEAKAIIQSLFGELKGALEKAIAGGGPASAVVVCKAAAPVITADSAAKSGWDVGRTALKLRNPAANSPDDWERGVLLAFEQRKAAGEDPTTMAHAEVIQNEDGTEVFRFMKAIPTAEVCLSCHGSALIPEVAAAIDAAYPEDDARGFAVGDIRGAFTLSKQL